MNETWKKLRVLPKDYLEMFVEAYLEDYSVRSGASFEQHPEDIGTQAGFALEWFTAGWSAAMEHVREPRA